MYHIDINTFAGRLVGIVWWPVRAMRQLIIACYLSTVTPISKTNNADHQRRQCIIRTHLLVLMICWLVVDEDVLTVYNHS
jgi:hypothetical protein